MHHEFVFSCSIVVAFIRVINIKEVSTWSKDPSTKVGAVTVGSKKEVLSQGFNGFPRNINGCHLIAFNV
jgi:deoxycytidylate deaminase